MKLSSMIFLGAESALIWGLGTRDAVLITTGIVFFVFSAFAEIAPRLWEESEKQQELKRLKDIMNSPTQEMPNINKDSK